MRYEKRTNKDGSFYYSFVWYDAKNSKRLRLTREEIRKRFGHDILTEEEATTCLKLLNAQYEGLKAKIERRLAWEREHYNFNSLLEQYEKEQKKRAPNSWANNVFYLKHYVLPFFLTHKKLNNIELWEDSFEDFKEWLESKATVLKGKRVISYSSKNHAINALNTFFNHMCAKKLVHKVSKCDQFPEHLTKRRTIEDVIWPDEMESIYKKLKEHGNVVEAIFFRYLFFSGMRFSEGLAISLADLFQGALPDSYLMAKRIKDHKMKYFGYIVSDSQVDDKWVRRPFKGKREINEKYARTVPVIDKTLWNDLVDLSEAKYNKWKQQNGVNKRDFYLFEGLDDSTATRRLVDAFDSCKLKFRSWHSLRHSRATWLIGETGDDLLARAWLGHSSIQTFQRYNHMYQLIIREARAKDTIGKEFKLKKV